MNIDNQLFYIMQDPNRFWPQTIAQFEGNKIVVWNYFPSTPGTSLAGKFRFGDLKVLIDCLDYGIKDVKSGKVYKFDWRLLTVTEVLVKIKQEIEMDNENYDPNMGKFVLVEFEDGSLSRLKYSVVRNGDLYGKVKHVWLVGEELKTMLVTKLI